MLIPCKTLIFVFLFSSCCCCYYYGAYTKYVHKSMTHTATKKIEPSISPIFSTFKLADFFFSFFSVIFCFSSSFLGQCSSLLSYHMDLVLMYQTPFIARKAAGVQGSDFILRIQTHGTRIVSTRRCQGRVVRID